jgi:hypothetical protein
MAGHLKTEILNFLAKRETTYGTDSVPTVGSNAFQPKECTWEPVLGEAELALHGPRPRSAGKVPTTIEAKITVKFHLSGAADPGGGNPLPVPSWFLFMEACGCAVSTTGSPVDTHICVWDFLVEQESLSIYVDYYDEGTKNVRRAKMTGVRFTHTHSVEVGGLFELVFECMGLWGGDEDVSSVTIPTFADIEENDDAAAGKAMSISLNSTATDAKSIKFKSNRSLSVVRSLQGDYGTQKIMIDSKPGSVYEVELDRPLQLKASDDVWGDWLAAEREALEYIVDTVGGTRLSVAMPRVQRGTFKFEKDEGIWRVPQTMYGCDNTPAGDTAVTFTVTRTP